MNDGKLKANLFHKIDKIKCFYLGKRNNKVINLPLIGNF